MPIKSLKTRASVSGLVFDILNAVFMVIVSLTILYPFLYLTATSFAVNPAAIQPLKLIPPRMTTANYESVFGSTFILRSYGNTIVRVALAMVFVTLASMLTAYPLANRNLPFRTVFTSVMVFTMFFNGGLIPQYILIRQLRLTNTIFALILPSLIPTFNMLIIRNFFMTIPAGLEESARVEGAGDYRILFQIVAPISKPIIATVVLWTVVGHWNAWFDGMLYITDAKKQVLQTVLRQIVIAGQLSTLENQMGLSTSPDAVKAATIIVATAPVIIFYPFVQKYFVKGIMVGSLKG